MLTITDMAVVWNFEVISDKFNINFSVNYAERLIINCIIINYKPSCKIHIETFEGKQAS
jgi:hypothetical protein